MKVTAVEAVPYRLPLARPVRFANGTVTAANHVLIRVHAEGGLVGIGEAAPRGMSYGDSTASVVDAVERWIAPELVGLEVHRREAFHHAIRELRANHTVRAAVDIALWDLAGKAAGASVSAMLGGFAKEVEVSHLLGYGTPDEMADEVARMRDEHGINAFKVKLGRELSLDLDCLRAVRETLGPTALLYIDANHGWTPEDALRAARIFVDEGLDVRWMEEPDKAWAPEGRRWLTERSPLPITGDESCRSLSEAAVEVSAGRCQLVAIKCARTGLTESQKIMGMCQGLGVSTLVGSQLEARLGAIANLHFAAAHASTCHYPAEVAHQLLLDDDILTEPLTIEDGRAQVPGGPGLGVTVDEDKLEKFRID